MAGTPAEEIDGDLLESNTITVGEADHSVTLDDPIADPTDPPEGGKKGGEDDITVQSEPEDELEFRLPEKPGVADDGDGLAFDPESTDDSEYSKNVRKRIAREERLKQEAREEAARLAAENAELRKRVADNERKAKASELDGKIAAAEEKLKLAKAEVDVDAELAAVRELARLEGQKAAILTAPVEEPKPRAGQGSEMNPVARAWVERNPWFRVNRTLTEAALRINRELESAGYDNGDPRFYAELNRRLKDEMFGGRRDRGRDRGVDRGGDRGLDRDRRSRPPVEGGRSSASTAGTGRNVVQLDRTDLAVMRNFGLDPTNKEHLKQFALEKRKEKGQS